LSRNFFLTPKRSLTRKMHEAFISLLLEQRLSKEQILTLYANDVYLGERGSFSIKGFGEGAAAYFGKDLTALTLPEAALLAAIIPAPNGVYSPSKHKDDAKKRRNIVLKAMSDLGFITAKEAAEAKETEINLARIKMDATEAPYLVDYIRDSLQKDFSEDTLNNEGLRIYTTLDPDLQRAAVDAVNKGLKDVHDIIRQRYKTKKNADKLPMPQASLIALDTKTGAIVAMVGGDDYGATQYNRITQANRQPGSIFKPFVYAAAFEASEVRRESEQVAEGAEAIPVDLPADGPPTAAITPITLIDDTERDFIYDGDKVYQPNNYHEQHHGLRTVRYALEHSLNVPTVEVAQRIGFDRVAALAKRAGMNAKIKGYPSIALGAFEVTPIEIAGAYTMFPNEGRLLQPHALLKVVAPDGAITKSYKYPEKQVLSPAVAYLMTHLMEGVVTRGTAAGVRGRGFALPAAGKTGTSRDGWFAGFTQDFVVIAWVGFDDNSDLNLEGARSALPIWTNFMLKAYELYPPRDIDAMNFRVPEGIEFADIDSETNFPANSACTSTYREAFLVGTVPATTCPLHSPSGISNIFGGVGRFFGNVFGGGGDSNSQSKNRAGPPTSSH
jgi:penicillin-binding protein 1B